jgi:hypothetical protein
MTYCPNCRRESRILREKDHCIHCAVEVAPVAEIRHVDIFDTTTPGAPRVRLSCCQGVVTLEVCRLGNPPGERIELDVDQIYALVEVLSGFAEGDGE